MNNTVFKGEEVTKFQAEYNLTSIVNKMTGLNAFVISDSPMNNTFQFNVNGYCFTIPNMKAVLDKLIQSPKTYLNVRIVMKDGYLYDKNNNFVDTSMVVTDEELYPVMFETSQTHTFTLKRNYFFDNLVTKVDYYIKRECKGYTTYVFTIVEKVKNGDELVFRVPTHSRIDNDESLLGLEIARPTNGIVDDGEL